MTDFDVLFETDATGLGLPEWIPVVSLWRLWAIAVREKYKLIETRTWEWPYEPGWLVIHASKKWNGKLKGVVDPYPFSLKESDYGGIVRPGSLCALVYVRRCRRLLPRDAKKALIYQPGLYAWELEQIHRMRPVLMRGPQKVQFIRRTIVEQSIIL